MGRTYCITGVSGYIGGLLARRIARDPDAGLVGIDLRAPKDVGNLVFYQCDIRDPGIGGILREKKVDTLIHLAFYTAPEGDRGKAEAVNIEGTRNMLRAASEAMVSRLVIASSAAAYGSHPDNPIPIRENAPLRPNRFFYYSWHKAAQERLTREWLGAAPRRHAVILRPCALIGPNIDNPTGNFLRQKVLVALKDNAPIQFLYEDDAAEAFRLAATGEESGVFNVASEGTLTLPALAAIMGKTIITLPYGLLAPLASLGKGLGISPVGRATLRFIRNPIVIDGSEFRRRFGFAPRYDSRQAFEKFFATV